MDNLDILSCCTFSTNEKCLILFIFGKHFYFARFCHASIKVIHRVVV